ncbi:hypothetical protein VSH64_15660 [Amycolatopsis rhabdoformis]|uniref:Uncharacterized protein n=1 Tax=Amycolatopsis rhabdoformis TaxID=1448059 RepID=A0ABZ1IGD0_9PSEU|nr:hypothetical protein [Amycolatopsis rhabdoformis]WSE33525.1 hypothetical protein VSH64_15660 [Amycolatopsis rhabdoformis]
MSERVEVTRTGPMEYRAVVQDGLDTTQHRVTMSHAVLDDLLIPDLDTHRVARETVKYLLEREAGDEMPEEIDLDHLSNHDKNFLTELKARLTN